ncbi:MAG: DNA translocase FtsK 4TM domain-containing protein [Sulfurimonas sp.]|uniref:DNA translocase FtsK n=1 Tax=Sulfurimonas sp. TaxID=2022749 RepID=UPI002615F45D|nr:DNA translocase FtsK 4TM domain-containing protein [Sulfurimonas sp.]MCW8894533.1 DNA translocase FtsK 4TM domain-containing protein [Sulfurimonas sp.]MCW8955179.1 DNA translocase FtsK 4TM domain-containing protein [Sulfurimonas sp.]MCW9067353.1 DNA translocase FtsK 4TM domain-containing protein [Sulfurimonas sp.]
MKDTIFIITFGLLIYLGFATLLGGTALMGTYGATFALYNHKYFGYISYVYIFASLIPLYLFYKNTTLNIRKLELAITSFLILFSFLLAQAMLVTDEYRGTIGADFVDFLSPYIGTFGLWVFWLIITLVSIVIIIDKNTHELVDMFLANLKDLVTSKSENHKQESTAATYSNSASYEQQAQEEDFEDEIDKPAYLRRENPVEFSEPLSKEVPKTSKEKHTNILDLVQDIKEQNNTVVVQELEENAKLLAAIEKGKVEKPKNFTLPSIDFLQKPSSKSHSVDESELDDKIGFLIEKLAHFKIDGDVVRTYAGPVVSTFEFKPAANVKVSKILNLQDDLAMALSAETIRIQAPIPGKDVVGIEIPNATVDTIYLRDLLDSKLFKESSSPLTIVLGKDIVGKPFITDLKKLPHLLIAGTTGSGKSVGINAMILSLLYKNSPDQLRLLMIDPKMLEFSIYNDIPHLLTPVITKAKQAIVALNNMVHEMERRYGLMSENRTKNIENYNAKVKKEGGEHLPYIVVIIDELADLMMTSGKDVEHSIARLAQMARASGIHLVVATQRPSVDVVTGLIKANLPSRISYRVGQRIDSKIILDQQGAESLLGKGDMLFTPPGSTGLVRLHAPWSTENEIESIVNFIKSQREPNYDKSFLVEESELSQSSSNETYEELDELYADAKNVILSDRKTSISYLQRKLQIGYNRSARLIEQLEGEGVLSAPNTRGIREII